MDSTGVLISKEEYQDLLECKLWVEALSATGVDSWEGYEEACKLLQEMIKEGVDA